MIADRVRDWLETHQRSAAYLADQAGITPQALNRIRSGDTRDPRLMTLVRIAYAMGKTLDELLADEIQAVNGKDCP